MTEIIKQEQGRSMVEMLGVLAVVGVLSVGGIAGYTYAMDKHKSNELLNEASKRAVIVAAQIAAGREPSLREFEDDKTAGGTISTEPATDIDGGVGIRVSGVKESVCKNLVKLENDVMYVAKDDKTLSEVTEADCSGDSNEFLIVFENMGGGSGDGTDGGTTITCEKSEKKWIEYYTGECCEVYHREKFCPGDEPATCVKSSSACDCTDKACCDGLGGSWATDKGDEGSICCAEGTARCSDWGDCICVPAGYSSDCVYYGCIACSPTEGTPKCSTYKNCICVPAGYSSVCDLDDCIACPSGQTPTCDGAGYCECV